MDRVDRLIARYPVEPGLAELGDGGSAKLDVLDELESEVLRSPDPRIEELLIRVIATPREHDLARIEAIRILALVPPGQAADPFRIATTLRDVVLNDSDDDVRTWAAKEAAPYIALKGVYTQQLVDVVLRSDEYILVRSNILSSIYHGGVVNRCRSDLMEIVDLCGSEDKDDREIGQHAQDILDGTMDDRWRRGDSGTR